MVSAATTPLSARLRAPARTAAATRRDARFISLVEVDVLGARLLRDDARVRGGLLVLVPEDGVGHIAEDGSILLEPVSLDDDAQLVVGRQARRRDADDDVAEDGLIGRVIAVGIALVCRGVLDA